jgi:3'-5' exonuclease
MIRSVKNEVWAFDAEWVPDPQAGRMLLGYPHHVSDREVVEGMWERYGATPEDPMPFLKLILCRVVSVSAVVRRIRPDDGTSWIEIVSLPRPIASTEQHEERTILSRFLEGVGRHKPQLVGFNSTASDLRIFIQRALVNGISVPDFCSRPNKPWEGVDYFARESDFNIDLYSVCTGYAGRGGPSLHELAVLSGVPGKLETDGNQVPLLWLDGKLDKIVAYNECDALTTYLVWLRAAHMAGHFTTEQYSEEQQLVVRLLSSGDVEHYHLYLAEWERLRILRGEEPISR